MEHRRKQRARHHREAHQAHPGDAAQPPLKHPFVPQNEPTLIRDQERYVELVHHLRSKPMFAFDTEFIGEVTYFPKTCLVQVATEEQVALIDPFAIRDLSAIWELVNDPLRITIVHAGASDLSPVRRALGKEPEGVIDVQVAAAFLGMNYPASLGKLVERFAGHPLTKGHTFTDWDARPLSGQQLRYAADDVRYLPLLWLQMGRELEKGGRLPWAYRETISRLEDPHLFDAKIHMRRASRGYDLTGAQEKLLEALCTLRDKIALEMDQPHRATIPDGALLEIVRDRPETKEAIAAVRGMPRPIVVRFGEKFLDILKANPSEKTEWFAIRKRREDEQSIRERVDRMLAAGHAKATELGIATTLALTRGDLERHSRRRRQIVERGEAAPPVFDEGDWRNEAFGDAVDRAWVG